MIIKRPFESSFPLSEKEKIMEKVEILSKGKTLCSSCDNVVPSFEIFDGKFTYLIKECKKENKLWKTLLHKGKWLPKPDNLDNLPYYDLEIGENFDGSLSKVKELGKVNTFVLRITSKCNLDCKVCLEKKEKEEEEINLKDIEKNDLFYSSQVALTGGEPTVKKDLPEIIKLLKRRKNWVSICTNGVKIATLDYLKKLRDSGLDSVLLSFNGFNENVYEKIWGGKRDLKMKLKALENLRKLNIFTSLQTTLMKGMNEDETENLVKFSLNENFIKGLWFKPVFLPATPKEAGLSTENLISCKEMREGVSKSLNLSQNYFDLFYEVKLNILRKIAKFFPKVKVSQPQSNQIILMKNERGISPLLSNEEMLSLIKGRMRLSYFKWLFPIVKSRFSPLRLEKDILKNSTRINIGRSRTPRDIDLSRPICYLYLSKVNGEIKLSTEMIHITPQD